MSADLLDVSLTGVEVFGGIGASFSGGSIERTGAIGFYVGSASVDLAIVNDGTTKWTGLSASLGTVSLEGVPGISFTGTSILLQYNGTSGASRLDWTDAVADGDDLPVITGLTDSIELKASGDVELDISSYISILHDGSNILALQGMNDDNGSSDCIISAELEASITEIVGGTFPFEDDLDVLEDVRVECSGQPFIIRSQTRGDAGKALQAAGVALGPTVRTAHNKPARV